jgi:hypothetical protein
MYYLTLPDLAAKQLPTLQASWFAALINEDSDAIS